MPSLLSNPNPREEVCRAAVEIAGARAAIIYEPRDGMLTCTATSGLEFIPHEVHVDPTSRAQRALDTGRPVFLAGAREGRVASVELWRAAGSPASVLYQPMIRSGRALGVLSVGWQETVPFDGAWCAAVALLAHEAAAVIAHMDAIDTLTGRTRTDALTGLANRQGFDAALLTAVARSAAVAVVALDLDGFEHYNASFGHPAGDRALKACSAGWLTALRGGDLLARVDGEEFALLLADCDAERAVAVADRLLRTVPRALTCSAGVAVRRGDEPADSLHSRANLALHAAKAAGRDQLVLSDDAS